MEHPDFPKRRQWMVQHHIAGRGVAEPLVLDALLSVAREEYLPPELHEFAYEDTSLPLPQGRIVAQPYLFALALAALGLRGGEKVLEIGTGCGWSSAVLSRIAGEVYTVEPAARLAERAADVLGRHGVHNVHVRHGEALRGWPEQAPFDAIIVTAGSDALPEVLRTQLAVGGRLVMPVGRDARAQELVRVTHVSELRWEHEDIADIRLAPLLGEALLNPAGAPERTRAQRGVADAALARRIGSAAHGFGDIDNADLDALLDDIGDARVVLLGEATHGSAEFYRMRQRITRELITRKGFELVAIEADWPDAARIDHYVRHALAPAAPWPAFNRFPTWMWRNREVAGFVDWLHQYNAELPVERRVGFHGLDLYSLHTSIQRVLQFLDAVDPDTAQIARRRYGCLTPWEGDPATYAHAAVTARYRSCEDDVVAMLRDMLANHSAYAGADGDRFLDALQNARLVANAERYYRTMYYGSRASWNLRDGHMFETLRTLMDFRGPHSKAVVWAHNSHVGDSAATEMALRGEFNIGRLCRKVWGDAAWSVGFGTDGGSVAAASSWGGDMEIKTVRPSHLRSYERLCHDSGVERFVLRLRGLARDGELGALLEPRLQRAIGVIYRPETELASHYFETVLPRQFDSYVWFDRSGAVSPLPARAAEGMPETYPFGV